MGRLSYDDVYESVNGKAIDLIYNASDANCCNNGGGLYSPAPVLNFPMGTWRRRTVPCGRLHQPKIAHVSCYEETGWVPTRTARHKMAHVSDTIPRHSGRQAITEKRGYRYPQLCQQKATVPNFVSLKLQCPSPCWCCSFRRASRSRVLPTQDSKRTKPD